MATTVLLVRHAAHPLVGRVLCGRMAGVHLDEAGRAQAARLAARLASIRPDVVHSSPLPRCLETAEPLAAQHGLPVVPCPALTELDFGAWTGRSFAALDAEPTWMRWNTARAESRPPDGESMRDAQGRAVDWLRRVQAGHPDATVLAVSHADVIKGMLLWCLGLTLDAHQRFDIDPCSISALLLWDGGGKVLRMNEGMTG